MIDIAYEVATYLDDGGFGTLGTDIFVSQIPEQKNGIWVERVGGQMNNYVPIEESVVSIYIKDSDSQSAVGTLESIKRYIHRMHTTTIHNAYVYTFLVIGDIESVQRDVEYAQVYRLSLQIVYRDQAVIS